MLPVNAIRDPRQDTRGRRAGRAVEILASIKDADLPEPKMRWDAWKDFHHQMVRALDVQVLGRFQADQKIAPQICGGGGESYLRRLRDHLGQDTLSFFLSTYRETLCGEPQDVTCVEGCYITRTAMRHLYYLAVLHRFCKAYYSNTLDFVEIGGGFGNLARLMVQYSLANRYFIVDYPATLCIQYYYLTEFFDEESVAVWTGNEYFAGNEKSKVCLVTPNAVASLSLLMTKPSFMVSTMAMTEIPGPGQRYYLDNLRVEAYYIFGQTRTTALPEGKQLTGYVEMVNFGLFNHLAATCHVVDFLRGDYYTEFLGLVNPHSPS